MEEDLDLIEKLLAEGAKSSILQEMGLQNGNRKLSFLINLL